MKYVIPILSLIISVIALAVALPRPNNLGFDYLGVIVALIAIATALAVGFQIWNALSLEGKLQKMYEKISAENEKSVSELKAKSKDDLKKNNAIIMHSVGYWVLSIEAQHAIFREQYSKAFVYYFSSMEHLIKLNNLGINHKNKLKNQVVALMQNYDFTLREEDAKKIINIIINSKDGELVNLVPKIYSIVESA